MKTADPAATGRVFAVDRDRAGSFENKIDLGLSVPVFVQRFVRGYLRDAHGERFAMGEVPADERFPVDQAPLRHVFGWPRFPLASALLNDDRFTIHPLTSLGLGGLPGALFPHRLVNKRLRSNFGEL